MTNIYFRCSAAVLIVACFVTLGGCSGSDQQDHQAQNAQAQRKQAKKNPDAAQNKNTAQANQQQAARQNKAKAEKKQASGTKHSEQGPHQARTATHGSAKTSSDAVCQDCGTIVSITPVSRNAKHGSGVGAVAGGIAGGALGSQIGHGSGKTIAEIAGVLGGAYAGNVAEKHVRKTIVYRVKVAMDAGATQTLTVNTEQGIDTGTRVRVQGQTIVPMQ